MPRGPAWKFARSPGMLKEQTTPGRVVAPSHTLADQAGGSIQSLLQLMLSSGVQSALAIPSADTQPPCPASAKSDLASGS